MSNPESIVPDIWASTLRLCPSSPWHLRLVFPQSCDEGSAAEEVVVAGRWGRGRGQGPQTWAILENPRSTLTR